MATAPVPATPRTDPVTKVLGNFGKWQLSAMLIIFLCKMPTCWFMAIIIFTAPAPNPGDYWCTPPENFPAEYTADWIARAHPVKIDRHNRSQIDYCRVFSDFWEKPSNYFGPNHTQIDTTNLTTIKCKNYTYHPEYHSLVAEFNLICGRELLLPLTQCFHIFGLLVGGIVAYFTLKQ